MAERKSNEGYLITYTKATKATNVRAWLLFGVELLLLVAILVYTGVTCKSYIATKDSIRKLDQQIELLNRDIKLSRIPRLSLGVTDKTKYEEYYKSNEDIPESQIEACIKTAELLGAGDYYYFKNVSPNTAFQIMLICYKLEEEVFRISFYTQSYIMPSSKAVDFLPGPKGEEAVRSILEKAYGRDVISELQEREVFDTFGWSLCYVLLYMDYANNLYALRRPAEKYKDNGFVFGLATYYDLGALEEKDEGGDRE